jgi:hypothetical protein
LTVERALALLRQSQNLPESEVELNRQLHFCLLQASRELYPEDEIAPISECNNQPDPDDEARVKREQKRPDFQWIYLDRYEANPLRSSKQFVVECKRLGIALRTDWILNRNYTKHGVGRFREAEWSYAKGASSGAMVGYWQSMEAGDVLTEVHEESRAKSLPDLILLDGWKPGNVSRLEHAFERSFQLSPFRLHHLWVDLRPARTRESETPGLTGLAERNKPARSKDTANRNS